MLRGYIMEFQRSAETNLIAWLNQSNRKPMVLRGARQVGKTWLVRTVAKLCNKRLIELNLERRPELINLFSDNDPKSTLIRIEAFFNQSIILEESILFLDEIQAAPQLLSKLRWFAEELPQLAVIAAGSLLEFVLSDHVFSMPVGRINYYHLEPLTFEEFLIAQGEHKLYEFISQYTFDTQFPEIIHDKVMHLVKTFVLIGGMPMVVAEWITHPSLPKINQMHHDLLASYRDDFAKYSGKIPLERLEELLNSVPRLLGEKFKYSKINSEVQSSSLKKALNLLIKARLCHQVLACDGGGVPLGVNIKERTFKIILLDVGLVSALLGLAVNYIDLKDILQLNNQGGLAEQLVGQLLRTGEPYYVDPQLYYWIREKKGSLAEVDYLIQHGDKVVPIEVKAGKTGTLKSLHIFMSKNKLKMAVRINGDCPSLTPVSHQLYSHEKVEYTLLSVPFYLTGQLHRLLSWVESGAVV